MILIAVARTLVSVEDTKLCTCLRSVRAKGHKQHHSIMLLRLSKSQCMAELSVHHPADLHVGGTSADCTTLRPTLGFYCPPLVTDNVQRPQWKLFGNLHYAVLIDSFNNPMDTSTYTVAT